jgi:hypothetical protein
VRYLSEVGLKAQARAGAAQTDQVLDRAYDVDESGCVGSEPGADVSKLHKLTTLFLRDFAAKKARSLTYVGIRNGGSIEESYHLRIAFLRARRRNPDDPRSAAAVRYGVQRSER